MNRFKVIRGILAVVVLALIVVALLSHGSLWLIPPVIIGLLWILVTVFPIGLCALTVANVLGIWRMALFFHFLDVVWIFIFTIAYVMGYLAEGCAGQYTDYSRGRVCPLFAADALGSI